MVTKKWMYLYGDRHLSLSFLYSWDSTKNPKFSCIMGSFVFLYSSPQLANSAHSGLDFQGYTGKSSGSIFNIETLRLLFFHLLIFVRACKINSIISLYLLFWLLKVKTWQMQWSGWFTYFYISQRWIMFLFGVTWLYCELWDHEPKMLQMFYLNLIVPVLFLSSLWINVHVVPSRSGPFYKDRLFSLHNFLLNYYSPLLHSWLYFLSCIHRH